jgi:hypothetical protein
VAKPTTDKEQRLDLLLESIAANIRHWRVRKRANPERISPTACESTYVTCSASSEVLSTSG